MKKKGEADIFYEFECINPQEFQLEVNVFAEGALFERAFRSASKKIGRDEVDPVINCFDVPLRFWNLVKLAVGDKTRKIYAEVAKDGVIVQRDRLERVFFKRAVGKRGYDVHILFKGDYIEDKKGGVQ